MTQRADKELLGAVLEPRKQGALQKIADAVNAGADSNALCPGCSTAAGPVRAGSTLLTHSVHEGASNAVNKLLECGADVNRSADDSVEWTPSFYARKAGKTDVADWLAARMSGATLGEQDELKSTRDPKYQLLYEQATASESLSTDDIVAVLTQWDAMYGLTVSDANGDSLALLFSSLPEDLDGFLTEVTSLCPDASDNESELRQELTMNKKLFLWWD